MEMSHHSIPKELDYLEIGMSHHSILKECICPKAMIHALLGKNEFLMGKRRTLIILEWESATTTFSMLLITCTVNESLINLKKSGVAA